ncbi:MAG: hypothetical protein EP347_05415 [Alphaproteobacteria bacterium]|nr:MAG: hypothetical protein EP347_05415 [Alphaproteobacteria bacterium]
MSGGWQEVIASVAPTLATALGGPLGGLAASVAGRVLLGREGTAPEEVSDFVLAHQTPEVFLKLRQVEADLTRELKVLEIEAERVSASDRASARERQVKTRDKMPGVLASVVFTGFFGILSALMFIEEIPEAALSPLNIMLGALSTLLVQIGAYYFGSSKGSAEKNALLGRGSP